MKKAWLVIIIFSFILGYSFAELAPEKDWRYKPEKWNSNEPDSTLNLLVQGEDCTWKTGTTLSYIAVQVPATMEPVPILWTFGGIPSKTNTEVRLEISIDTAFSGNRIWHTLDSLTSRLRLEKFTFMTSTVNCWYRLVFNTDTILTITDLGLYKLDKTKRNDYWLIVGASIQAQSIRNHVFKEMVKENYLGYDPVVFNLAVSGWRSGTLRKALPDFLKTHPYASYVGIHIGGNNVTPQRPYPGGAEDLKKDLVAIIQMIQESGKIPILSRLSYRAYKGTKPVPPEENGSGPYVEKIYDPLIKKYCPLFFDSTTEKGKVNAYDWFKKHQDELLKDGIHVTPKGEESWNRLWVDGAGSVIYQGNSP